MNFRATAALVAILAACGCSKNVEQPLRVGAGTPIVIISIDTLRSDRLPAYGYGEVETPAIDRLRADGILFERAYTHVPLTLPAHASLFSGTLPPAHGVRDNHGYSVDAANTPLLQQLLSKAGYATGGAVSSFVLRRATGIADGFDFYDDEIEVTNSLGLQGIQRPGDETLESVKPWLRSVADNPFFLFFHIYEPHSPYEPPEPFASQYESDYDGEVAAADAVIGKMLDELRSLGVYDQALIVLLSDHGEGLGEHGESEHGLLLYRTTLQVPLIVKLPDSTRGGETVTHPVQLIDIYPTIVSALGMELDETLPGSSLFAQNDGWEDRPIYSETFFPRLHCGWSDLASLVVGAHHYIDSPDPELFDLLADPGELENLVATEGHVGKELVEILDGYDRTLVAPGETDPETRRRLAALGYLGGASVTDDEDLPDPKTRVGVFQEVRQAYRLMSDGDYAAAEEMYLHILEENPGLEDAWEYLARVQQKMGRPDQAMETIASALARNPGSPTLNMSAATLLFELDRLDEAAAHVEFGLSHDASAAHQLLAQIALNKGDFSVAESEAREAMALEIRREGPRLVLADVLRADGRPVEAIKVLQTAYNDGIRVESVHTKMAQVCLEVGEIDRAAGALAGLEDSVNPETLVLFGRLAGLRQQWDDSRRWFEKVLEVDPSNPHAKVNLGILAAVEGRPGDARRLLEEGVAGAPGSFDGWNALGMVRARSGDPDGAVQAWSRAMEINPRANELLFNLGLASAQAGQFAQAADYMDSYAKIAEGDARSRALGLAEQYRQRVRGFGLGIQ